MTINTMLFYDEAMDQVEITRKGLVSLAKDLDNKEIINNIFRAIHTLKGCADIYGFKDIVNIVHKTENLLDEIRNNNINMSEDLRQLFFNAKDIIETLVEINTQKQQLDPYTLTQVINLEKRLQNELITKSQATILIVDSDSSIREFAKIIAQEAGYDIVTANNCNNALESLKNNDYDLIFSDMTIVHPNKLNMLKEIKQLNQYKYTPIVVLIKQKNKQIHSQSKSLGVTAWLKKPFDKTSFLMAIEKFL